MRPGTPGTSSGRRSCRTHVAGLRCVRPALPSSSAAILQQGQAGGGFVRPRTGRAHVGGYAACGPPCLPRPQPSSSRARRAGASSGRRSGRAHVGGYAACGPPCLPRPRRPQAHSRLGERERDTSSGRRSGRAHVVGYAACGPALPSSSAAPPGAFQAGGAGAGYFVRAAVGECSRHSWGLPAGRPA
jgi:hypothetical protein